MTFLDTARTMMDLSEKFPSMRWEISSHDGVGLSQISIHLTVPAETAQMLMDAGELFS